MHGIRQSIRSYYRLSLAEGEGVGTAYEYYAKAGKLRRFLNAVGRPKTILVAGLPERYGFSLDFLLLAERVRATVLAIDERSERISRAREIVEKISAEGILGRDRVSFRTVCDLGEFGADDSCAGMFDLALSCEVMQRLDSAVRPYMFSLRQKARNIAIFVPNRGNTAHARHSGLRCLNLSDLQQIVQSPPGNARLRESGYVDMPPFPPGINRSQTKREQAAESFVEGLAMKMLEGYGLVEGFWPRFVKARFAHIAYAMATFTGPRTAGDDHQSHDSQS